MNRERRKSLKDIAEQLETLKGSIEDLQSEEEEYRDNMLENLLESERHEKAEEAISNMEDAVGYLEDAISSIEEAAE